ncbi:MAG: dTDP-4-dehydrorhamnose reductase [Bacteroides sp.]|nr:dTDP-4-dehydrorhamnose reductase [Bacteroides sp.]
MNILITGANGQLGNEIRQIAATDPNHHWIFTDVQELDITCKEAIGAFVGQHQVDCIVNCAAYTAVDNAEEAGEIVTRLNSDAPGYLAEVMQSRGGSIIHVSTDYVFNGQGYKPYRETDPTAPASVYGGTKLEGERRVLDACEKGAVIRTSWLYSIYGNSFVKTMIRLGQEREQLSVIFDQVGTPTYAADLAAAILAIINKGVVTGIYHYSNEGVCSWYDFTRSIHKLAGITTCKVVPIHTEDYPTKAPRPHYSVMDKTHIKNIYGIEIPHWEDSLEVCIKRLAEQN